MHEVDAISAYKALLQRISPLGRAYLHVLVNPDSAEFGAVRALWPGVPRRCATRFWDYPTLTPVA